MVVSRLLIHTDEIYQSLLKETANLFPKVRTKLKPKNPVVSQLDTPYTTERIWRDYEPTNAINLNTCDYRRWVRVKEWFNTFAQGAE